MCCTWQTRWDRGGKKTLQKVQTETCKSSSFLAELCKVSENQLIGVCGRGDSSFCCVWRLKEHFCNESLSLSVCPVFHWLFIWKWVFLFQNRHKVNSKKCYSLWVMSLKPCLVTSQQIVIETWPHLCTHFCELVHILCILYLRIAVWICQLARSRILQAFLLHWYL